MTAIPCPVAQGAEAGPADPALLFPGGEWSYAQLHGRVTASVAHLKSEGFKHGNRVALSMATSPEYIVLLLAMFRLGLVACPLSTRLPAQARQNALAQLRASTLITQSPETIRDALEEPRTPPSIETDQWATIIFTSGSSGPPKPAVHSYENHHANAHASNQNIPLGPGHRWLMSLPLFHVAGLGILFRCMLARAAIVLQEDQEDLSAAFSRYDITHASLVATQLRRMLDHEWSTEVPPSLKALLMGGSAMPQALVKEACRRGLPIFTTYGMTEMATQITTTRPGDGVHALLSSGKPIIENTITLADDGQILVRGQTRFLGYRKGETLELKLTNDGWFVTGDLGKFDADGYLHVTGRKDNLFISGGENIQPEEIEEALRNCAHVQEAIVVPIHDPEFGFIPLAYILTTDGNPPNETALAQSLESTLPRFKIPKQWRPWPQGGPGDAEMKIDRAEMKKRAQKR